jgi:hypothetical protein
MGAYNVRQYWSVSGAAGELSAAGVAALVRSPASVKQKCHVESGA